MKAKIVLIIEFLLMLTALDALRNTDSYYFIYLLFFVIAILGIVEKIQQDGKFFSQLEKRELKYIVILSIGMALAVMLANYRLKHFTNIFAGGFFTGMYALSWSYLKIKFFQWEKPLENISAKRIFISNFMIIAGVALFYLWFCAYPGILTPDSIDQVNQTLTGNYNNHHPYWHTQVIHACLSLGYMLFGNLSGAIATYSVFSICFMASSFAFLLMTLAEAGFSQTLRRIILCWLLLMPIHVIYSVTMWKNILFSGAVLFFAVALFRFLHHIGKKKLNYALFAISGLEICVWQSNGIEAFVLTLLCLFVVLPEKRKVTLVLGVPILCLALIMVGPLLHVLGVRQSDVSAALSIPQQQIGRVLHDKKYISEADKVKLAYYTDIEKMPEKYVPHISDNMKGMLHEDAFKKSPMGYFQVWGKMGVCYPKEYAKAWIDETRGYYNGGYKYWIIGKGIDKRTNNLGIDSQIRIKSLNKAVEKYTNKFSVSPLAIFTAIGFHVWLLVLLSAICLIRRKKDFLLAVPALSVILTLLISTPVFSEFRYAYSVFTTLPLMLAATFYQKNEEN